MVKPKRVNLTQFGSPGGVTNFNYVIILSTSPFPDNFLYPSLYPLRKVLVNDYPFASHIYVIGNYLKKFRLYFIFFRFCYRVSRCRKISLKNAQYVEPRLSGVATYLDRFVQKGVK